MRKIGSEKTRSLCISGTWRTALLIAMACGAGLLAQPSSLTYPQPRKGDVVDDYFGTKVADPYRWMEDLNAPEVKQWVDAENAVTFKYLDALPQRDVLKKRITELWNYPKVTTPRYEGRHWFYNRNSGLQRQSVVFTRETLNGSETVALDPNSLSPDGSVALSGFVPAPDAQHFAYGQADGGSDWSTYYIRELGTGKQLPDVIRWVKFSSLSWTEDGKGFFYGRYPEPRAGKALEDAVRDKKIYYHALGTAAVGRSPDLRTARRADALHRCGHRRDRPVSLRLHEQGHEQQERAVREGSRQPDCADSSTRPVRPLYPGHTAAYDPLGVVDGTMYLLTDRDAPNKKVVAVPIDRPDAANWKTIVPESRNAIQSAGLIAGKLAVNALVDVASEVPLLQSRRIAGRDRSRRPASARSAGRSGGSAVRKSSTRSRHRCIRPRYSASTWRPAGARRSRRRR